MSSRNHEKYSESTYDYPMAKKSYPSDEQDRFIIRLPDGMRDKIAEAAKSNNRSMNAEVVARLEASLKQSSDEPVAALNAGLQKVSDIAAKLINSATRIADSADDANNLMESVIIRNEKALRTAVEAVEAKDTSPNTLALLKKELAGLQYFIEGLQPENGNGKS